MYAVIKSGGKQYKVSEGDILNLENLREKEGRVVFDEVILLSNGDIKIGNPTVAKATVTARILGNLKGDKVRVAKFKSKVRYRRVTGFRSMLTQIQIEKIEPSEKSSKSKK